MNAYGSIREARLVLRQNRLWGVVALALVFVLMGFGQARAIDSGLHIAWDHCGDAGVANKSFSCDRNSGSDTVVVWFRPDFNMARLVHADIAVSVCSPAGSLPDLWRVLTPGDCRFGALTAVQAEPGANCAQIWDPIHGSTQSISRIDLDGPSGLVFNVSVTAVDSSSARDIVAGQDFEIVRLVLSHAGTSGPGACTGCAVPIGIAAPAIWLYGLGYYNNLSTGTSDYVTWQGASSSCSPVWGVPVRNRTWGELKTRYR